MSLTVVEIYCECIRDLLVAGGSDDHLTVLHDRHRGIIVAGATEIAVQDEAELLGLMQAGLPSVKI